MANVNQFNENFFVFRVLTEFHFPSSVNHQRFGRCTAYHLQGSLAQQSDLVNYFVRPSNITEFAVVTSPFTLHRLIGGVQQLPYRIAES